MKLTMKTWKKEKESELNYSGTKFNVFIALCSV